MRMSQTAVITLHDTVLIFHDTVLIFHEIVLVKIFKVHLFTPHGN